MSQQLIAGDTDIVLPTSLIALITNGAWPTSENSQWQNLKPIYRNERAYKDRFCMETLYLYPPPFRLVAHDIEQHPVFWKDEALIEYFGQPLELGIEPTQSLIIGDFGPGTDAVLILDYQHDQSNPRVMGMDYGEVSNQKGWTLLAKSINEFCQYIGLP